MHTIHTTTKNHDMTIHHNSNWSEDVSIIWNEKDSKASKGMVIPGEILIEILAQIEQSKPKEQRETMLTYDIITANYYSDLIITVNQARSNDWKPLGAVAIHPIQWYDEISREKIKATYFQTMVKEHKPPQWSFPIGHLLVWPTKEKVPDGWAAYAPLENWIVRVK